MKKQHLKISPIDILTMLMISSLLIPVAYRYFIQKIPVIPCADCLIYNEGTGKCVKWKIREKEEYTFSVKNNGSIPLEVTSCQTVWSSDYNKKVPLIRKGKKLWVPVYNVVHPSKILPHKEAKFKVVFSKDFLEQVFKQMDYEPNAFLKSKICYFFVPILQLKDGATVELKEREVCFTKWGKTLKTINVE